MKPNSALSQPAVAVDTLLGISSSPNSRILENKSGTDERGFGSHLQAQEKQRQQQHSAQDADRPHRSEERIRREPVADKPNQSRPESETKAQAATEVDDSSESEGTIIADDTSDTGVGDSGGESRGESGANQSTTEEGASADQFAGQVDAIRSQLDTEKASLSITTGTPTSQPGAVKTAEAQIRSNPLNGGFLAKAHLQGEGSTQTVDGSGLPPAVTAGANVTAIPGVHSPGSISVTIPVAGANAGQAQTGNVAVGVPGVAAGISAGAPDALASETQIKGVSEQGKAASESLTNAASSEKSTPAVTTQLAMASAKTATTSEASFLAQVANAAVDKMAAVEGVTKESSDTAAVKAPLAASRLIAPAFTRYQMEGQASVAQTRVQVPVGQPQWPSAVAERVMWMSSQRVTSAEIHLDPPELGPLAVRVSINQDTASVTFSSQHAAVREALDLGAFRLREMFESEGLDLANVDVSDQGLAQQSEEGGDGQAGSGGSQGSDSEEEVIATSAISSHDGWVDHYV